MPEFLRELLQSNFMPHGHCYLWRPEILWLHALSDGAIALAYYTIPFFLIYFVRKRRDLAFPWIFVMFGAFILLCGTTHVLEIWSIWNGTYRLTGVVKAVTGLVSIATACALVPLMPRALSLASPEQLRASNDALRDQMTAREQAETGLRQLNEELEHRVAERTAALEQANRDLQQQVAEREKAERALRELNRTLEARVAERTAELTRANTALERRNRELQEFASAASHDLQEPLRKITTFASLIRDEHAGALDEAGQLYLERVHHAAARMSRLVLDLLKLSRVATKGQPFEPVDLGTVVAEVLTDLEVRIAETGASVEVGALPVVEADPTQMRQLFQNLVGNALKFHREGVPPAVRITAATEAGLRPPDASCRIEVADDGIGFEQKYAERIFAPFQRLHGKAAYEGTGIGLSIVQRIVERHNGTIEARGAPGQGATFVVHLPVRQHPGAPPPGPDALPDDEAA